MKKLLYIAISSQTGGVPKHILHGLQYAREHGYQVSMAVPDDGDYYPWFEEWAEDMVKIDLNPYSIRSLMRLRKYVKEHQIALVHSHGKGAGMYARPLKLLCPGMKVVHTFHGIYVEKYTPLVKAFYLFIERSLKYFSDAEISVSQSEEQEAKRLGFVLDSRSYVIPNGVDMKKFPKDPDGSHRHEVRQKMGWGDETYVIGCVARLEKMKGHQFLLDAYEKFQKDYPDSRLILVGDGPDRAEIEQQIRELHLQDYVAVTGFRHDIPDLLCAFDVFVSASLKEGMPFTLLEALAAGKTVVATNVIGNKDIIKDHENGLLTAAESGQAFYEGLKYAKEHPEECRVWEKQGVKTIEDQFTIEQSMKQLFAVYDHLLGENRK